MARRTPVEASRGSPRVCARSTSTDRAPHSSSTWRPVTVSRRCAVAGRGGTGSRSCRRGPRRCASRSSRSPDIRNGGSVGTSTGHSVRVRSTSAPWRQGWSMPTWTARGTRTAPGTTWEGCWCVARRVRWSSMSTTAISWCSSTPIDGRRSLPPPRNCWRRSSTRDGVSRGAETARVVGDGCSS